MGRHLPLNSVRRRYWQLVAEGVSPGVAGEAVGVSHSSGWSWFRQRGGVNPQLHEPQGNTRPRLSPLEREEIRVGTVCRESERSIACRLGRAPSTIMREIANNGRCSEAPGRYRARYRFGADRGGWDAASGYRACIAQARSEQRARRPKMGKLDRNPQLREVVEDLLKKKYSPEQISGRLPEIYPDRPEMRVSHETIYKHHYKHYDRLYVQGRGQLRAELRSCLRTGRVRRKPRKPRSATETRGRISGMVNIAERPPEADARAVPGHWESQCCCQAA